MNYLIAGLVASLAAVTVSVPVGLMIAAAGYVLVDREVV